MGSGMGRYLARRALQSLVLLFFISLTGFTLYHIAPNSPFSESENPEASAEDAERLAEKWGLRDPLPVQYLRWAGNVLRGDLGVSYFSRQPVSQLIMERLPNTLTLAVAALVLGYGIGIPLGVWSGLHRGSLFDRLVLVVTVLLNAAPDWYLGLLALILFGTYLGWLPLGGVATIGAPFDLLDRLRHLFLPALILSTGGWLSLSQLLRSETIEVMSQDYVRTARAKGLAGRAVVFGHILRNSLIPVITASAGLLVGLIGGAVLIEQTFSWPGMGRQTLDAAFKRDFPIMLAMLLIGTTLLLIGRLLADVLYAIVDPRIRYT